MMSTRDPKPLFLKNLRKLAALCIENNRKCLFTEFIASIPLAYSKVNKNKQQIPKPKTWSEELASKKAKNGFKRSHTRELDKDGVKNIKGTNPASKAREYFRSKEEHMKTKQKEDVKNTPKAVKRCMLCKTKSSRINDHYMMKHNIDFPVWIKKMAKREKKNHDTTCLQCKVDYKDAATFRNHIVKYHNVDLSINLTKRLEKIQKSKNVPSIFDKLSKIRDRSLADKSREKETQKKREFTDKESNAQSEILIRNKKGLKKGINSNALNIQQYCMQCETFVDVASFQTHIAEHQRENNSQNTKNNTQITTNNEIGNAKSNNSCNGVRVGSTHDAVHDTGARETNYAYSIQSEEVLPTTPSPRGSFALSAEDIDNSYQDLVDESEDIEDVSFDNLIEDAETIGTHTDAKDGVPESASTQAAQVEKIDDIRMREICVRMLRDCVRGCFRDEFKTFKPDYEDKLKMIELISKLTAFL